MIVSLVSIVVETAQATTCMSISASMPQSVARPPSPAYRLGMQDTTRTAKASRRNVRNGFDAASAMIGKISTAQTTKNAVANAGSFECRMLAENFDRSRRTRRLSL